MVKTIIFTILFLAALGFFINTVVNLVKLLLIGKYENRFDNIPKRIKNFLKYALFQFKMPRYPLVGIAHIFIYWGFLIIGLSSIEYLGKGFYEGFHLPFLTGRAHHYFEMIEEIVVTWVVIAVAVAFFNRLFIRPKRLDFELDGFFVLILIWALMFTSYFYNAARIILNETDASYLPISNIFAGLISDLSVDGIGMVKEVSWWIHILVFLGFLNYIPYSKHLHLLGAMPNTFFSTLKPKGILTEPIDFEKTEVFGVAKIEDFTWKQLLDIYACTHCRRCSDNCPAWNTGKPLSPGDMIFSELHDNLFTNGKKIIRKELKEEERKPLIGSNLPKWFKGEAKHGEPQGDGKAGSVSEMTLWSCTTCRACMEECPVTIEHVPAIIQMRQSLVMMESKFPKELATVYRNLENNFNPWGIGHSSRGDFVKELGCKTVEEMPDYEILYWVGCAGSFDDRNKKVTQAMVKLLNKAGVKFAVLGPEEKCNGEIARRTGNEYLFKMLADENIATLKKYNVKKILTQCPHCYNTLKHDYSQLGFTVDVIHHTEFLNQLINDGRIKIAKKVEQKVVYHDSCYLGRYNNIYSEPRNIVRSVVNGGLVEMKRSFSRSFCCGAGGGNMWYEMEFGKRVNIERFEQAQETGAEVITVACPFCMAMFDDAVRVKGDEKTKIKDIAEILAEAT